MQVFPMRIFVLLLITQPNNIAFQIHEQQTTLLTQTSMRPPSIAAIPLGDQTTTSPPRLERPRFPVADGGSGGGGCIVFVGFVGVVGHR